VDNTAAIHLHNTIVAEGLNDRSLLRQPYKTTIIRLANAMKARGALLQITHPHSHLEHKHSTNDNLNERRQALAGADAAADVAHASEILPYNTEGVENFPLITPLGILEKAATTYLKGSCESRWGSRLSNKTIEGALHRAHTPSQWPSGSADWPDYLRIFRHKLWTDRLPTAAERHKRGDQKNGELVPPHCPHCLLGVEPVAETQTHLLHTCLAALHRAHILNRDINNLFRKYT
jgi:hypothetical protein